MGFSISAINITDGNKHKQKRKKIKGNFYCSEYFHVHFSVSYAGHPISSCSMHAVRN